MHIYVLFGYEANGNPTLKYDTCNHLYLFEDAYH